MSFKVAFIGAGNMGFPCPSFNDPDYPEDVGFEVVGGTGFVRSMFTDLMSVPEFHDIEVSFTDSDERNLRIVTELCQKDLDANEIPIKIQATTNRREALKDAKYIFNSMRVGDDQVYANDTEIPLKYGVDQCFADTVCAGGIMYGQRMIAAMGEICKDIREVSRPDVLQINDCNPNPMVVWACNTYYGVNTIGCCHGVVFCTKQIGKVLGINYKDLDIIAAGLNHRTFFLSIKHNGEELKDILLQAYYDHPDIHKQEKVRVDVLKNFGCISTETNGHLSEYVSWYRNDPEKLKKWISMDTFAGGETAGFLRLCSDGRMWYEEDCENWIHGPAKKYDGSDRSQEHGSYIVEALETGRVYREHLNVINHGAIKNLPDDCVVELPVYVDRNGINVPVLGELPTGIAALCSASVSVERLSVMAAVEGNIEYLRQAMLLDPLVGACCDPDDVIQMIDEFLIADADYLPQYRQEVEEAKKRWAQREENHTLIQGKPYMAGARLPLKTLEELKEEKRLFEISKK